MSKYEELESDLYNELRKGTPDFSIVQQIVSSNKQLIATKIGSDGENVIHYACEKNAPLTLIQDMYYAYPIAIQEKINFDLYPLHFACSNKYSDSLIQFLVKEYPIAVQGKGYFGRYPLHFACLSAQSELVIKLLVNEYPMAVHQMDENGESPLHLACRANSSLEVIQFLVKQWPDALTITSDTGDLPLECAQRPFANQTPNDTTIRWLRESMSAIDQFKTELYNELNKDTPDFNIVQKIVSSNLTCNLMRDSGETVLHYACSKNAPLAIVKDIIKHNPSSVQQPDNGCGWYALHHACWAKQSPSVIRLLVEEYPMAGQQKAFCGRHPLHLACINNHSESLAVIQVLVKGCPIAVQQHDDDGDYPLHFACQNHASFEVIQFLVKQWPDALMIRDGTGSLPWECAQGPNDIPTPNDTTIQWLQEETRAIHQLKTDLHNALVQATPDFNIVQQLMSSNFICNVIGQHDETLLHYACLKNAPSAIVKDIIKHNPSSVQQPDDDYGWYPLHHACWTKQSPSVIQLLIEEYPMAGQQKAYYGRRPLHLACINNHSESLAVIQVLVKGCPIAVQLQDNDGYYPLHLACQYHASLEVIQFLVKQWPDAFMMKDEEGRLPLQCFGQQPDDNQTPNGTTIHWMENEMKTRLQPEVQKHYPDFDAVLYIVSLDTEVLCKPIDTAGRYLLHYACWKNAPLAMVTYFIKLNPNAVQERSYDGYYPLHFACDTKASLDIIDLMVRHYPNAVQERNYDGYYPLHLACDAKASLDIIYLLVRQWPIFLSGQSIVSCNDDETNDKHTDTQHSFPPVKKMKLS